MGDNGAQKRMKRCDNDLNYGVRLNMTKKLNMTKTPIIIIIIIIRNKEYGTRIVWSNR